jgi:hypothetical protein
MSVGIGATRTIEDISVSPERRGVEALVGAQGGGGLRRSIAVALPGLPDEGAPLYLLLDEIAGASLIAGFAWSRWVDGWMRPGPGTTEPGAAPEYTPRRMEGICAGFRPGSTVLTADGLVAPDARHNVAPVPPLADPDDPDSWHQLDPPPPVAMRRSRRIDVWGGPGQLLIDAMFRDSCWEPDGSEVAVHEYHLSAVADRSTGLLTSVVAEPRILPWRECPAAAGNAGRMIGTQLRAMRSEVLNRLQLTDCCTHLNDALRALADVPALAASLPPRR